MSSDIRVSILDAIAEYDPSFDSKRALKLCLVLTCALSILCSSLLIDASDGWNSSNFLFKSSISHNFYNETADCFYISIIQCIILPLVAYFAIILSKNEEDKDKTQTSQCHCFRCFYIGKDTKKSQSFDSQDDDAGGQPLLQNDTLAHIGSSLEGYEFEDSVNKKNNEIVEDENTKQVQHDKNICLAVLFVLSTTIQVYIGLKCISFNYIKISTEGSLMGLEVLWVNIITWLLRELIERGTKEEGELIVSLHPHRLHLHTSLAAHWCDLCGQQCKNGKAYRCKLCDFDLCIICYAKKDTFSIEGQLRGDKVYH